MEGRYKFDRGNQIDMVALVRIRDCTFDVSPEVFCCSYEAFRMILILSVWSNTYKLLIIVRRDIFIVTQDEILMLR
jgi:hypothetical protein